MTMKSTDLEKHRGLKPTGKMAAGSAPDRFGAGAAAARGGDKRQRREQDRALGQVPFACKLPIALVKQLQARGAAHAGGINALTAELLAVALAERD